MTTAAISDLTLHRKQFLGFLLRRVDSHATAEDILQSAYTRALEQSSTLRDEESAIAWFYRILRNAVIDYYRHRAAEDRALERWARDLAEETRPDPQTQEIVCECIGDVLSSLKPAYREVIREVELGGSSLQAFAERAHMTAGNAAVRVHRARQALKKQLTIVCGTCAKHGCIDCSCGRSNLAVQM
jgi:RNA polymerase sigma factor (sigma-70 family)